MSKRTGEEETLTSMELENSTLCFRRNITWTSRFESLVLLASRYEDQAKHVKYAETFLCTHMSCTKKSRKYL
jgi:hypothetical protein